MPRTVAEAFAEFLASLTPSSTESSAAMSHRASIEECLANNFELIRLFRTGSFGNGTSIAGYSDVDYFASLGRDDLSQSSTYTLSRVRDALVTRFPATGIRVNCPAVRVPFGRVQSETTEVVPADEVGRIHQIYQVYEIPDCEGGWMRSSPDAHNDYVRTIDNKHRGRVKPLIRFIKAWKYYLDVPISSFYLELRVAKYADAEETIEYAFDVQRVLDMLYGNDLANMQDPMGVSGYIRACKTESKYDEARSKLLTASVRADKALEAFRKDDFKQAFYWWGLLWDGRFPTYHK